MRAVLQRVSRASVNVIDAEDVSGRGRETARLDGEGLLVLLGITHSDGPEQVRTIARKICELRILSHERSVVDAGASVVIVSQFTLYADVRKGRRPSWNNAAPAEFAAPLVQQVIDAVRERGVQVGEGEFGAHMRLDFTNDGPMTILIEA